MPCRVFSLRSFGFVTLLIWYMSNPMSGSSEPGVISGDMETAVLMRIKKLAVGSRGEAGEKSPFLSSEEAGRYTLEDAAGATAELQLILGNPPLNSCLCQAASRRPPRHLDRFSEDPTFFRRSWAFWSSEL